MSKKIIGTVVAVLVLLAGALALKPTVSPERFGGTTNLNSLTLSGNISTGGIVATSTATSTGAILNQVDLYTSTGDIASAISFTASTSATTLTFAASSTFTSIVPNSGDTLTMYLINASTTGTTTTIAGGTGTTVLNATTTKVLAPGAVAQLTFQRLPTTNINILLDIFK
jgi:hypothetical protein